MRKRLTGLVLAVLMLASLFVMGIQPAVADSTPINQEIVQGGAILHCFDWSYNEIRANLQDIKDAGYVAVQTSPVQPAKDFNAAWTDTGGNWWKLYQPLGLRIAGESESWLGTKEELTALCNDAESHDTYLEDNGTSGVPSEKIVRTWAIVGARAESTALYLARPNELMGKASTDTAWKSPAVAEVNKFKTYYAGKGEWMSYNQEAKITWLERGEANNGAGVVIAKLDGAGWVENLEVHLMSDGVYADSVSGNIFAVEGGKLRGTVGPTGVAVVYKTSTEPAPTAPSTGSQKLYLKPNSNWLQQGARFAVYTFGGGEHWYSMTEVDATEHIYEAEITNPYTKVIFCRMNPDNPVNSWASDSKRNQTADLTVPSDKNLFTLTEDSSNWNGNGTWGVYGDIGGGVNPTPVTEDEGYYLVGTMTGWSVLPEYKMTRTGAATEEYTIDVPLIRVSTPTFHSRFKVVYSPDGVTAQTWFPGGDQNNYGDFEGEIPMSGI